MICALGWLEFDRHSCRLDIRCTIGYWSMFSKIIFWFEDYLDTLVNSGCKPGIEGSNPTKGNFENMSTFWDA